MPKTLVIHPHDPSTDMLELVYRNHPEYTVCRDDGITPSSLKKLIEAHDRIIMLGHGTPAGLINSRWSGYIIDDTFAELLKTKDTCSVWCYSSDYFRRHDIPGFHSGMIISEVGEEIMQLRCSPLNSKQMFENITLFSKYLGECIEMSPNDMRDYMLEHYSFSDPVTSFNRKNITVL